MEVETPKEFKQKLPISDREREALEMEVQKAQGKDISAVALSIVLRDYYVALTVQGFTSEQAMELVKTTCGYLLRGE